MAEFEDQISAEEAKLAPLIRLSFAMHFIKYKKDFYSELQEKNIDSFDKLTGVYYQKLLDEFKADKVLSGFVLSKMVK